MSTLAPTSDTATVDTATFTGGEHRTLNALRIRYAQDRDLFSERERERLRFLRWLYLTGRIAP